MLIIVYRKVAIYVSVCLCSPTCPVAGVVEIDSE